MPSVQLGQSLEDDCLYLPEIKRHSLQKIQIHNLYAGLFTTAMRNKWPQMAYVGLYSGAGRARVQETGEIIETTAMSVFRLKHPFTKYIFVDSDPRCAEALEHRIATLPQEHDVSIINKDVRDAVPEVLKTMPRYSRGMGLLSFCFIDPFSAAFDFQVIKALSQYKMDFLILLMLGRDVRTNFRQYYEDTSDTRIAGLIDDPDWREEWRRKGQDKRYLIRFLLEKFNDAMARVGYTYSGPDDAHPIRVAGKGVFLYSLVFYSKSQLGQRFWDEAKREANPQLTLDI